MSNEIAARLREYAAEIENGRLRPTKMILLLNDPSIVAQHGFGHINQVAIDRLVEAWKGL